MLAVFAAVLAAIGIVQTLGGWVLAARFARGQWWAPSNRPPVTILKPLYGDEPLLDAALGSVCRLRYPEYQVVFGVSSADDTAIPVVRRLQSRFPGRDLTLVVDPTRHGPNLKVGNLINMLSAAHHEILVIADSDVHVRPDYLDHLVAALEQPATGLATTLYAGLPASRGVPALLGATQITHTFLPGALLSRALGRQDCLGATMALRRATLCRIGGFEALVAHLADDNALGRLVQATGLGVRLAATVPLTTVPEDTLRAAFRHELRWARTIRALVPGQFAASCLQYPIFWGLVALILAPAWGWVVVAAAWMARIASAQGVNRALGRLGVGPATPIPIWLLPLRELMSVGIVIASFTGLRVEWRGHTMTADGPAQPQETHAP
jgi:ceramide glucosyltransferase